MVTITGTGSTLTHSTTVTLVVTAPANFTITATPASVTISRGGTATYTVTGLRLDTSGTRGPVTAEVGTCVEPNDQFEATIKVAFIGEVDRIQGADRYITAREISKSFPFVACGV